MSTVIKLRRGTEAEWSANGSTILASGEPGFELDTGRFKIGDGVSAWSGLYYASIIPTGLLASSGISINLGTNGSFATIGVSGLNSSYISDFNEAVDDRIGSGLFVAGTGINLNYNDTANTFTVSVTGVSFSGHTHVSSDITDFSSSVSGLIPVKDIFAGSGIGISANSGNYTISVTGVTGGATITNYGDNRLLTSDGTSTGINGESNLTFDGTSLLVNGTGVSVSGHTHASSDITDFNSAVSGLLPVKNILAGTGISVASVTGVYTITSTGSGVNADSATQSASVVTTVFNATASTIPKMSAVYINGGQGDQPTIQLAIATGDATSAGTYGLTFEPISSMGTGKVIVFGALTGVNTDQFNPTAPTGNVNGTVLYLSPTTSGTLTTTKPSAPNHIVALGTIVRTHQNAGVVEVRVQNGFELDELHNVAISGATNGQFLQYNSATQLWVPSSSGNFTTLQLNGTTVSVTGHTHTASDITDFNSAVSGLLPTIANSGDNRILTSTGSSVGINAESNLTFDGSLLSVTGSGSFVSGVNVGGAAVTGLITGLSTTATVPSIRFQSITANHTAGNHLIFDWYKNISTRLFYITGAGSFYADSSNGNFAAGSTNPSTGNGAFIGNGMRRHDTNVGMDFTWGESITSTSEPGIDLYPIGGTHIASGILFRLSKNSTKTDVAMLVNGSGNVGIGTTTPTARLQVNGQGVFNSGIVTTTGNFTTSLTSALLNIDNLRLDSNTISSTNSNGDIDLTPNGTGEVNITKIDIDSGAIDNTTIGLSVASSGKFTQLYPTVASGSIVSNAVSTDVTSGQIFDITLTDNITLNNPTNSIDGVTIRWRIQQDGTGGRTVALDTKFQIPSSASNPLPWSTGANVMDTLAATYHAGRDKWDVVAFVPGY